MNAHMQALTIDPAALRGLSPALINSHHQNNYGGAVKRLNAIRAQLSTLPFPTTPGFQLNGLKREELIATNSMLLHELYFTSLGGDGKTMEPAWAMALEANFGSVERWRDEFVSCAKALGGGSGWMLLSFQPREGTLVNQWAADHAHAVAGAVPLLALDMYEHAYHIDYGAGAAVYVDAFMDNIDWAAVYARYQAAVKAASDALVVTPDDVSGRRLLDVRRAGAFARATQLIQGARWCDPAQVAQWAAPLAQELRAGQDLGLAGRSGPEVIVYCVHGHEVSRATALRLRAMGLQARFLGGGIEAWKAAGRPLTDKSSEGEGT